MKDEYFDLLDKYETLEGCRFLKQLNQFSLSLYIFEENYEELVKFLDLTIQKSHDFTKEKRDHDKAMFEIIRLIHNFVASAQTLVDNTRVFYKKEYEKEKSGLFPDYKTEIQKRFSENKLQLFVKGLRRHFQHYKIPLISFSIQLKNNDCSTARYFFSKESLSDFDWKLKEKQYIEEQYNGEVDIKKFVSDYYELTKSFYDWFIQRQMEIRKNEIDEVHEYEGKLLSLQIEDEIERFIDPTINNYNPMVLVKLMILAFPHSEQEKVRLLSAKQQIDLFIKSLIDWKKINISIAQILQRKYYDYITKNL